MISLNYRGRSRAVGGVLIGGLTLALVVSGCAPSTSGGGGGGSGDGSALEQWDKEWADLSAQIAGKSIADRRAVLIPIAQKANNGEMTIYGSQPRNELNAAIDKFEDITGLTVNYYEASNESIQQRVFEERDAGIYGVDALGTSGDEAATYVDKNIFAPMDPSWYPDSIDGAATKYFVSPFLTVYAVGWNTDKVAESEIPKTWKELLTNFPNRIAFEGRQWDWFYTLATKYLEPEEGMTQDQIVDLFTQAASKAFVGEGNSFMAGLLGAGEFDIMAPVYHNRLIAMQDDGAHIGWSPALQPMIGRPTAQGVARGSKNPAAALLWDDFVMSSAAGEGQDLYAKQGRNITSKTIEDRLPNDIRVIVEDPLALGPAKKEWEPIYTNLLKTAQTLS